MIEVVKTKILFPPSKNQKFSFIDLFCGIGGFRLALQDLQGKCVFSSEWDKECQNTYSHNFNETPYGDITNIEVKNKIPKEFDVLCAGFPCQPFSIAGNKKGFNDRRGTLFFDIYQIIKKHKPKIILLENVSNLVNHNKGNTYNTIIEHLDELGYALPIKPIILSPDNFGLPVLRPRVFIPCVRKDISCINKELINNFSDEIKKTFKKEVMSIDSILESIPSGTLTNYEKKVIKMWDDFYKGIDIKVIGFPIWVDYFTYKGDVNLLPKWKSKIIQKNILFYNRNKIFIDKWLKDYDNLDWCINFHKKLEWSAGDKCKSAYECLIQFRQSGIRFKKPDRFSTLVAMNQRQIIGKLGRRISVKEAQRLQSFPDEYEFISKENIIFKQLGNSVNVSVVKHISQILIDNYL